MEQIEAGNVAFKFESREVGRDGGPTIRVHASVDGNDVELLRFDCFRDRPHYHYHPSGENVQWRIDPTLVPDSLGWVLARLRQDLDAMIAHAGYPDIAGALDPSAVANAANKVADYFGVGAPSSS